MDIDLLIIDRLDYFKIYVITFQYKFLKYG